MTEQTPTPEQQAEAAPEAQAEAQEMSLEQRFQLLAEELNTMRDKWLRAEAETQNVRARAAREVTDARAYAVQKFAADVVEAAENLRRGL
ncbi:MAG: nucleotide exchange factor GrpE, partial [Alphaproteobacteria bacterium]|nr:nucleotide exchange factor GrpE [Alphaproteobacteria bacterium]